MSETRGRRPVDGLILAAGSGDRFGGSTPKAFVELAGEPMLLRAARAAVAGGVERLVVVVPRSLVAEAEALLAPTGRAVRPPLGRVKVVAGGASRVESTRLGLAGLAGADDDVVVVHDAARPLATAASFRRVVAAVVDGADGATLVVPSVDTIAFLAEGRVVDVPARDRMTRVQTPQAFRLGVLRRAHLDAAAAGDAGATDDCGLVLRYLPNAQVVAVAGEESNLKITTPADLRLAEALVAGR